MGKPYSNDSIVLDTKGRGVFQGSKPLDEGLFMLYFTDGKYVDFMVGNEEPLKELVQSTEEFSLFYPYLYYLSVSYPQ